MQYPRLSVGWHCLHIDICWSVAYYFLLHIFALPLVPFCIIELPPIYALVTIATFTNICSMAQKMLVLPGVITSTKPVTEVSLLFLYCYEKKK